MRRRDIILGLGTSALLVPTSGQVLGQTRRPVVAYVSLISDGSSIALEAFTMGMAERGWMKEKTYDLLNFSAGGQSDRLPAVIEEALGRKPDVLVTAQAGTALALHRATSTIPIVCSTISMEQTEDFAIEGKSQPRANVTGIYLVTPELTGKLLEVALEVLPRLKTLGVVMRSNAPYPAATRRNLQSAADALGLDLVIREISRAEDIETAIRSLAQARVDMINFAVDPLLVQERVRTASLSRELGLPTVTGHTESARDGHLLCYGAAIAENWRRAAYFVDKLLTGSAVRDLPVEFPARIKLVINLKTARALGLAVLPSLLARADEVIE